MQICGAHFTPMQQSNKVFGVSMHTRQCTKLKILQKPRILRIWIVCNVTARSRQYPDSLIKIRWSKFQ